MTWRNASVSAAGTHHLRGSAPLYAERFDDVLPFHAPGLAPVRRGDEAWHIHVDGSPAYDRRFLRTFGFYEGLAAVVGSHGWHHIRTDGSDLHTTRYAWCGNFQDGRCTVREHHGAYLHITPEGTPAYTERWRYAGDFRHGVGVVQFDDGRSTHIDARGEQLHGLWFLDLDVFHKAYARARDDVGWMHIDREGRPRYARRFAAVEPFYNGQARVERFDGGLEVINEDGQVMTELRASRSSTLTAVSTDLSPPLERLEGGATNAIRWIIPLSVSRWLAEVPRHEPVALLLRHSVRDELPPGDARRRVPISETGVRLARELGATIGDRLRTLHTSPLTRCVQTAEALRDGAGAEFDVVPDRLLGDPGAYVIDAERARAHSQQLGHEGVMADLVSRDGRLPGMADPDSAARFLVQHMLAVAGDRPGIHVFVTHDSLVTTTAARLLGEPLGPNAWPWYLEGAFFWREGRELCAAYRDEHRRRTHAAPCTLDERDVIDFGRREITRAVGSQCGARFFLAGGAFKALLTGRPPRDLDLWAASERDREVLIQTLLARGARRMAGSLFADAFTIAGRSVDVPLKVRPATLEERLAEFDIGLSAVGVEHEPGDHWRAVIHPLARSSAERREVLLLKPLVNWKFSLATLERLRRYADELGYVVPPHEEAEIWKVFESQPAAMKRGMLERFDQTGFGGYGVREEASCRLP